MPEYKLRVDQALHAKIEEARGDVPRERWVRGVIVQALAEEPVKMLYESVPLDSGVQGEGRVVSRADAFRVASQRNH